MGYKVTLAHFVHDENHRSKGGKPGDQTGTESCRRSWYIVEGQEWYAVFRANTSKIAEKIAQAMEDLVDNEDIGGYNQDDRTSAFEAAKAANWDIKSVRKKCNADCSAAVALCINAAGIPISKDMYTGNERCLIEKTGKFKTLESDKYCRKPDNLKRGDILLKQGHTAIVVKVAYNITKEWRYDPDNIMKGDEVKHIQAKLNQILNLDLPCTTSYGKKTRDAVMSFQKMVGLSADGIVGKKTAKALGFGWG